MTSTPWTVRPQAEQSERWERAAAEMEMGKGEFLLYHAEAGLKKFDRDAASAGALDPSTDVDVAALREAYEEERRRREEAEERAEQWQGRALEHTAVQEYMAANPDATAVDLRDYLADTVALRLRAYQRMLDAADGKEALGGMNPLGFHRWRVVVDCADGERLEISGFDPDEYDYLRDSVLFDGYEATVDAVRNALDLRDDATPPTTAPPDAPASQGFYVTPDGYQFLRPVESPSEAAERSLRPHTPAAAGGERPDEADESDEDTASDAGGER